MKKTARRTKNAPHVHNGQAATCLFKKTAFPIYNMIAGTLLLLAISCDPKDNNSVQEQDFSCIKLFDEQGQPLGLYGDCTSSDDWDNLTLSASEKALLDFPDTVGLGGTVGIPINTFGIAPCPVKIGGPLGIFLGSNQPQQWVKLKAVVVDESLAVVQRIAVRLRTNDGGIHLFIDPLLYETGRYYRLYYLVSAEGAPVLYEGRGNFLVCKDFIQVSDIKTECM